MVNWWDWDWVQERGCLGDLRLRETGGNTHDTHKSGGGFVWVAEGLPRPAPAYTLPATHVVMRKFGLDLGFEPEPN
jgi:hypothetical protein